MLINFHKSRMDTKWNSNLTYRRRNSPLTPTVVIKFIFLVVYCYYCTFVFCNTLEFDEFLDINPFEYFANITRNLQKP